MKSPTFIIMSERSEQRVDLEPVPSPSQGNSQNALPPLPEQKATCNCEKSRCLKLYCECFSWNLLCHNACNCRDCLNSTLNVN